MGFRSILLTGTEYIFLGALLGAMGFNILDSQTINSLEPFLLFGLSLVGFLFGLQFEIRQLKNLPLYYFTITALQALITFLIVSIPTYYILLHFLTLPKSFILMASITLGSTAACTAQSSLAIVSQNYIIKNIKLLKLMRYISGVDGLFSIIFFAGALCIIPRGDFLGFNFLASFQWIFVSATTGLISAVILILLSQRNFTQQEFLVFLIGIIMFCAGLAYKIQHSPLVSGLICGIICANYCRHRLRALSIIVHSEKSIYIILLLLLGATWKLEFNYSILITLAYIVLRIIGKVLGTFTAITAYKPTYHVPPALGLGLLSEGGLAIAVIVNFKLLYPDVADPFITVIILSVFFNEFLSPRLILNQFTDVKQKNLENKNNTNGYIAN